MTKAYSNKALPSGTILREWRLEEVLGVGGFGIVYKGRGIYFDELVAIKEYFPSAISERDEEATVVPIDSDAEEVHALGLKKFVEEAKLLWNLSTPSRHPNIVSVRSLFEIHGTAYMVMDFEDGVSLTDVLNRGERFDEAKLREMVLPVASGLERAHRVGVLHRDIKPSNILITDKGQPVLIDFGSARFEAEGVTSTTVTFHTPPYAAIEQYVKTYEQGPWTDIYALGVVLYRCITGEKPPEVLERMHGEKERPLVDGDWPGYSRNFLAAVDAAMIIKPTERPRSLPEWLAMFNADFEAVGSPGHKVDYEEDDEATRIVPMASAIGEIKRDERPGQPNLTNLASTSSATGNDAAAQAKGISKSEKPASQPEPQKIDPKSADSAPNEKNEVEPGKGPAPVKPDKGGTAKETSIANNVGKGVSMSILIGGAAAVVLIAGLSWALIGGSGSEPAAQLSVPVAEISHVDGFGPALAKLAQLAKEKNIATKLVGALEGRASEIEGLESENASLQDDPSREADLSFNRLRIADLTRTSLTEFGEGLGQSLTTQTQALVSAAPWADPRKPGSAAKENTKLQRHAATLVGSLAKAEEAIKALREAESAEAALPLAQKAILAVADYSDAIGTALKDNPSMSKPAATPTAASSTIVTPVATAAPQATSRSIEQIRNEIDAISDETDRLANEVIRMARARDPGRNATDDQRKAFQTLKSNADAARDYKSYIDRLKRSARGVSSPAEAEQLLVQGRQTKQYVNSMILSSRVAEQRLAN